MIHLVSVLIQATAPAAPPTTAAGAAASGGHDPIVWLKDVVLVILTLAAAGFAMWKGASGKINKAVEIAGGVLVALFIAGLTTGNASADIGATLVNGFMAVISKF